MADVKNKTKRPLTEVQAQAIIAKINDIYHDFELEIERLRKKRDQLIADAGRSLDQEKIKKIRQQLK
ncbi:MAG: hypothetical protein WC516_03865 [Patescibacteria group bacterium]